MFAACIAILQPTGRYHVVLFRMAPMPGPLDQQPDSFTRWRSVGHHAEGTVTFDESLQRLNELEEKGEVMLMSSMVVRDKVLPLIDPVSTVITPPDKFEPAMVQFVSLERADELQQIRMKELEAETVGENNGLR